MADATTTPTTPGTRASFATIPVKLFGISAVPTPLAVPEKAIQPEWDRAANLSPIDQDKARAARQAKLKQWAALNLRQVWADEGFMRGHLRVSCVKVSTSIEPATLVRMKAKLRAVGIHSPELQEAIGMPLGRFLDANPRLPLWAALALVLESTGRFTPEGFTGDAE